GLVHVLLVSRDERIGRGALLDLADEGGGASEVPFDLLAVVLGGVELQQVIAGNAQGGGGEDAQGPVRSVLRGASGQRKHAPECCGERGDKALLVAPGAAGSGAAGGAACAAVPGATGRGADDHGSDPRRAPRWQRAKRIRTTCAGGSYSPYPPGGSGADRTAPAAPASAAPAPAPAAAHAP